MPSSVLFSDPEPLSDVSVIGYSKECDWIFVVSIHALMVACLLGKKSKGEVPYKTNLLHFMLVIGRFSSFFVLQNPSILIIFYD